MSLETVVVAIGDDDEERVASIAATAIDIAEPAGATVHLVHVFSDERYEAVKRQLEFDPDAGVSPDTVAKRHATIREVGTTLDDAGVEYAWHGAVGDTSDEVLALATAFDADMLIVGGRGRSPTGKAVFGSTAQEILLNAGCPVTYIRKP
ncbi:universal stress protein family protein [Halolamina pelagica]|uniref:Universal stress protein family protein n=1 Tax=Halolamina pelagica TaxID=699431 RepID=A0A0P7GYW2_9EURY|nr:universal stress protein [Halolamina pelagica]KPN30698.1 universal stress protein family protein [Halolamina pelagica]